MDSPFPHPVALSTRMSFHWPDHKYLGPGTTDFTTDPLDEDDYIAMLHDLDYDVARTEEDIDTADVNAIKAFGEDFITQGNIHSAIGATGLGLKYALEALLGRKLYPDITDKNSPKNFGNALYAVKQRFLAKYAKDNNISFREVMANQTSILKGNCAFFLEVERLRSDLGVSGSDSEGDKLNSTRATIETSTQDEPRPGTSGTNKEE